MASEIQFNFSASCNKNGASVQASSSKTQDMAGDNMISNVQIIGTSNEAIVNGDVTATGWMYFKNLDAANFIQIFLDDSDTYLVSKLLPGEFCWVKPGANLYAKADTAPANLQVLMMEL